MTLNERIAAFEILFDCLQDINGRIEKERVVQAFKMRYPELIEDWTYILETLDGKHPIGWTFVAYYDNPSISLQANTIKDLICICENVKDRTFSTTSYTAIKLGHYGAFIAPIVNRTLRLGIGKSLLEKSDLTPMLAKKYEGELLKTDYAITEKLDGNRCIASFDRNSGIWRFTSRSGKPLKVNFDMSGFDQAFIYDGEVMSEAQTNLSMCRFKSITEGTDFAQDTKEAQLLFNKTSGLINRYGTNKKGLVYNIFDIVSKEPYIERRKILTGATLNHDVDTRILPVLYIGQNKNVINNLLGSITQMGGEGIMLNDVYKSYAHKRTDALLKYKRVQFMDMKVIDFYLGTGKYTDCVGGLTCRLITEDKRIILCDVGSGLSDAQREQWAINPGLIIGKIVQIGYHELTQNEENIGTNVYSLRFPRLIKVRNDKDCTSEY